ncbi:MAG: hypothetical protein WDM85_01705 [Caulobacteraceae bacterium]
MAAIAEPLPSFSSRDDRGFFLGGAIAMAVTIAAGFSLQLAMGRSSFGAPPLIHAHAIAFMGWVVIYLTQNILVASGNVALHRRLGWLAAGWVVLMVVLGCAVTAFDIRVVHVPFFFRPAQFLVFDPAHRHRLRRPDLRGDRAATADGLAPTPALQRHGHDGRPGVRPHLATAAAGALGVGGRPSRPAWSSHWPA